MRSVRSYSIHGGSVQAHPSDVEGLEGLHIAVPKTFWRREDMLQGEPARIPCVVAAECVREFRHTDGSRARTYLLEWNSQFFPIKRDALLSRCLTPAQRVALDL